MRSSALNRGDQRPPEPDLGPQAGTSGECPEEFPLLPESGEEQQSSLSGLVRGNAREALKAALEGGLRFSQLGSALLDFGALLSTPLGHFWQGFEEHAAARGEPAAHIEVLPISTKAINEFKGWSEQERSWLCLICGALNFQYCAGFASPRYMRHQPKFTKTGIFAGKPSASCSAKIVGRR